MDFSCGEGDVHEWTWDEILTSPTCQLSECNLEVQFHPIISEGTAFTRGNKLLDKGRHHFWEIKMLTPIYGTDVMIGIGTKKLDVSGIAQKFVSLLGHDQESWGFSYNGYIQHNGQKSNYSVPFEQGNIIGVHLDTWGGTLQFFLNRKPLGAAFNGLRNIDLYPMICSTAAQSRMKLVYNCSIPASLQMECLAILRPIQRASVVEAFPALRYLTQSIFAEILQRQFNDEDSDELEFLAENQILDDFDFALIGVGRKKRKKL